MSKFDYAVFSDGGGQRGDAAASACIVEDVACARRLKVAAFLGGATNNEAEITGGLLAFSLLRLLDGRNQGGAAAGDKSVQWVCDSEYVLKSATGYIHNWLRNGWKTADRKPVKNQGLWRSYLCLSAGYNVVAAHVRGHSGHTENEDCDRVCTWLQQQGDASLRARPEPLLIADDEESGVAGWVAIDGREFLAALRSDEPETESSFALMRRMEALGIVGRAAAGVAGVRPERAAPSPLRELLRLAAELRTKAGDLARCLPDGDERDLAAELAGVIGRALEAKKKR